MKMGRVGLSYCRYSSSASISSVTAGTNDMPCTHACSLLNYRALVSTQPYDALCMEARAYQVHYALLEQVGGQVRRSLVCCISLERGYDLRSSNTLSASLRGLCWTALCLTGAHRLHVEPGCGARSAAPAPGLLQWPA